MSVFWQISAIRLATLLALGWPTSAEVGRRNGSTSVNPGQWAKDHRDAPHRLLGVWDASARTFRHPAFQFDAEGHLRDDVKALLAALAQHPDWTAATDANGWRRAYWLYQPFRSLSRSALAFADAHSAGKGTALNGDSDGALAYLQSLRPDPADPDAERARTPAEAFADHPEAVIAFAAKAAAAGRPDTDVEGQLHAE